MLAAIAAVRAGFEADRVDEKRERKKLDLISQGI